MELNDELLAIFRDEVAETLDALAVALEALRADEVEEPAGHLDEAFRHAHNLKGAARVVGYDTIVGITHVMEDVLSVYRETHDAVPAALAETMLSALTIISRTMEGEDQSDAAAAMIDMIRSSAPFPRVSLWRCLRRWQRRVRSSAPR